jgi:hypothetical protein
LLAKNGPQIKPQITQIKKTSDYTDKDASDYTDKETKD